MMASGNTKPDATRTIWTVGHSSHDVEHFLAMLARSAIGAVADVRRFPGSRRQPQFQQESLEQALGGAGIAYKHFPALGGRRRAREPDSPNTAWRVESFNAYADHMRTHEFQEALVELEQLASSTATAILCAEAVPWRCHRRLIADALLVRGWKVLDIYGPTRVQEHRMTEFASVEDGHVFYPGHT